MNFFLCLSVYALAALTGRGRAGPTSPLFAAERESEDANEVGPPGDDWKLWRHVSKTATAFEAAADSDERSRAMAKEIAAFVRLAQSVNDDRANLTDASTAATEPEAAATEPEAAPSDRLEAAAAAADDDGGNFEDIVRKISTDLKKLYVKVKQVMTVVKNWYALWNVANTVFAAAG